MISRHVKKKAKSRRAARSSPVSRQFGFRVKRVYEDASPDDGARFLVDGLWPRGVSKKSQASVQWLRELAPSAELRKWYGHESDKWAEFRKGFRRELANNADAWKPLVEAVREGDVTLLTASRDVEISNAAVLQEFLNEKARDKRQ